MAKQLSKAGIVDGSLATAAHVTQSVDAFTGIDAYDVTISGSLEITGSLDITGSVSIQGLTDDIQTNVLTYNESTGQIFFTGSNNVGAAASVFPYTGSAIISGSLEVTGSTKLLASDASDLTLLVNESASFEFLDGAPTTGSYILQTSPDTGKGAVKSYVGQGTANIYTLDVPNQVFGISYTTGSGTSEGEITFAIGKRDLTNTGGGNINSFYAAYEPGAILSNNRGEVEFHLGEHQRFTHGVLSEYRGGETTTTQTSSYAGYFSASAFPNQQEFTRPFAISTISDVEDGTPALVVNKNADNLTSANFTVDYGGKVTGTTGSFDFVTSSNNNALTVQARELYLNGGVGGGFADTFNEIQLSENGINMSASAVTTICEFFTIIGSLNVTTFGGHITASGHGLFQSGKPIVTHIADLTPKLENAGRYHIVGGDLTCSISTSTAPVGAEFEFFQTASVGNFLFETASGITLISKNDSKRLAQLGSSAVLKKITTSSYHLMGDLT